MLAQQLLPIFVLQMVLSLAAWGSIALWLVVPYVRTLPKRRALLLLLIPQMFRHIGVTLLVPGVVSPDIPAAFALPTAIGDTTTQLLAVLTIACLHQGWRYAFPMAWVTNTFGLIDLLLNGGRAALTGAIAYLHAAWFVPTFLVPLMVVSHLLVFWVLLRRDDRAAIPATQR